MVIQNNLHTHAFKLLEKISKKPNSSRLLTPSLRILGNLASGNDQETQVVIDLTVIPIVVNLMKAFNKTQRKESCYLLSNIAAGN